MKATSAKAAKEREKTREKTRGRVKEPAGEQAKERPQEQAKEQARNQADVPGKVAAKAQPQEQPKPARPPIAPDAESIARDGTKVCGDAKMLDRFAMEAAAITRYITQHGLTNFIDVGCWYGLLLRDALMLSSLHTRMDSIVAAVDAIPAILSFARRETDAALGSPRIKWINAAVVPESVVESAPMVRVHAWDTSRSGVFATEGTIIPNVKTLTIRGLLEDVFDAHAASVLRQHLPRTYLKIDAEGCDEGLVGDLLTGGLLPAVIHFEVQGREYAGREIVRLLREAGYRTPKQFGAHSLYSLVCPRRDLGMPAAAIAFGPDQVYWDDI